MKAAIDISVILCTRNRSNSLSAALESLLNQEIGGLCQYEIIVVDNHSTDRTKEVIEGYIEKFGDRIRYAFESEPGLSCARNKGVKEAQGRVIAFTDDDCIIDRHWIAMIYACAQETDFDGLGGRILPKYPSNTPAWIRANADLICGPVLNHDFGEETKKYVLSMGSIFGANMAFKKEMFEKHGHFREDLGAGRGTMGEDTEFYDRLSKKSSKLYYCGKVLVWHPAVKERMTLGYIARWNIGYGRYCVVKHDGQIEQNIASYWGIPRYLFRELVERFIKLIFSCLNSRKFLTHWVFLFREIGMIKAYKDYYLSQVKGS